MCWRRLCTAFGEASNDLCSALACTAKRICMSYIDPKSLTAYTACRLIPLNKNPGVRPIGIGEVVRRIIGKAVMKAVQPDLQKAVGPLPLCAGMEAGCETAFHTMSSIFTNDDTQGALFVDATSAFNSLNRHATLLNTRSICPPLAPILINTYRDPVYLFVDGEFILSQEGTTQGDPLAMAKYAIGTLPLIRELQPLASQVWYADDSAAGSTIDKLKDWWTKLCQEGAKYGYLVNNTKTKLLVKEEHSSLAHKFFGESGITIVSDGVVYLGGAIGSISFSITGGNGCQQICTCTCVYYSGQFSHTL